MDTNVSGNRQIQYMAEKPPAAVESNIIINKDCLAALKEMPDESVDCCVTSPPYYGLRDYGMKGQIGREETPELYVERLAEVIGQIHRVLSARGTLWLNIADSYCGTGSKGMYPDPKNPKGRNGQKISLTQNVKGCKNKDMIGIPWRLAFALRDAGWYLRSDIIWQKGNAMPENVKDRPIRSYEHVFLFSKSRRYYYDSSAAAEPAALSGRGSGNMQELYRNGRDVWMVNTVAYKGAHFAAFPPKLALKCILAGCPKNGIVIDPFFGSGTTGLAAVENSRRYIGIELNPAYCMLAEERIRGADIK